MSRTAGAHTVTRKSKPAAPAADAVNPIVAGLRAALMPRIAEIEAEEIRAAKTRVAQRIQAELAAAAAQVDAALAAALAAPKGAPQIAPKIAPVNQPAPADADAPRALTPAEIEALPPGRARAEARRRAAGGGATGAPTRRAAAACATCGGKRKIAHCTDPECMDPDEGCELCFAPCTECSTGETS